MSLRKALRIISAFIAGVMCVSMCAFGVITERDLWIEYRCSFDINADRFSDHFLYDYADNGVWHCSIAVLIDGVPELTVDSGSKSITLSLRRRTGSSDWSGLGQYYISNVATSCSIWDRIDRRDDGEEFVVGYREEQFEKRLGYRENDYLALDMIWGESGRMIRMYSYDPKSRTDSGNFTATSKMIVYNENSFEEYIPEGVEKKELRRCCLFIDDGVDGWVSAAVGTKEAEKVDKDYQDMVDDFNEHNKPYPGTEDTDSKDTDSKDTDSKDTDSKDTDSKDTDDDDWDVKETETTYMTYDVFEPEKGTIKKSYAKPYEEYKTVLLETVKFSGKYKKTEKTDLYKTLAADGESITGVLKHYSGGDTTHFFTLTLTGPRDSVTLWKYMLTKEMTSEKTTKNLLRFSIYGRVENGKAYNYYGRKEPNMEDYQFRGAVNDNKLTKIGFEVWETSTTMLGTMTADSVEYEMESAAKSDDYGKWLIKLFSAARGSLNTSMLGMRKEYWGLTKEESITQNGGYYDEDGNQHSVMRNWNNLAIKGTRYEYGKIIDKIEINVPQSLKGISTDGNTKFEMFLMEEKIIDDATDAVKKVIDDLVLKVSGNSGTKYYRQGDSVWRQPEGMTSSVGGNVGSNQSYTGWREVKKVNGLWELEFVDTASMTANFSDKARTGISSFEFNFNDETLKFGLDEIDYVGPLLNFFYMDAINDDTDTIAKALGLFPEDLKGLRK